MQRRKLPTQEIKDYVIEHTRPKVSSLYVAQVKQKRGIIEQENYNKVKSEDAKRLPVFVRERNDNQRNVETLRNNLVYDRM